MSAPIMLFAAKRPAILALVNKVMGTQGDCLAIWKDQPNPYTPPATKTLFKLALGPLSVKGADDEARWSYDSTQPLGEEMQESITGYRLFTLKVLCECSDQTDGATAFNYLETLRTRLRWSSSRADLNAVNVAIVRCEDIQDLSRTVDNRAASIANLDIRMSTRTNEADPNRTGYIATVEGPTGTLT